MATVIGFPADLDAVELLYTSLLVQANTRDAAGRARRRTPTGGRGPGRSASRSWWPTRTGSGCGCRRRLCHARAGGGGGLRERARQGPGACAQKSATRLSITPSMRCSVTGLVYDRGSRATDQEGWASGLAAADMAALHNREQVSA